MLQIPTLRQEQPAHDEGEAAQLTELAQLVATTAPLPDLRDLAHEVRRLFPEPSYSVGCGSSHIWLHRTDDPHRLAFIIDQYK
jgi:hypothetical protein